MRNSGPYAVMITLSHIQAISLYLIPFTIRMLLLACIFFLILSMIMFFRKKRYAAKCSLYGAFVSIGGIIFLIMTLRNLLLFHM